MREPRSGWLPVASFSVALACAAIAIHHERTRRRAKSNTSRAAARDHGADARAMNGCRPARQHDTHLQPLYIRSAYESLIGRTPAVKLERLSALIERNIYVKMESMNPGGTGKDRAAWGMVRAAQASGALPAPASSSLAPSSPPGASSRTWQPPSSTSPPSSSSSSPPSSSEYDPLILQAMAQSRTGGLVVEGTSGSTGISLATLCRALGHGCLVVMPDDQALEKRSILQSLGATVAVVRTASYSSPLHYVNVARAVAARARERFLVKAAFIDQFENPANYRTHLETTGPEIWEACPSIDAFCMSSGTGGTIAGVGLYLKRRKPSVRVVLVDPPGSSLYNKIAHGVAFAPQQSERSLRRHRYDTIAEGIGLDRVTRNLQLGLGAIDGAVRVTDQEALDMAHWLLENEGMWLGSSSAMNVAGAVRTARSLPVGSTVVTLACDGGQRHVTRFWNRDFCVEWGLTWPGDVDPQHRVPACLLSVA